MYISIISYVDECLGEKNASGQVNAAGWEMGVLVIVHSVCSGKNFLRK